MKGATFYSPSVLGLGRESLQQQPTDIYCWAYQPQSGDLILDIGAGIGTETLPFSRIVGDSGRVIAVEASPRVFDALSKTISANGLTNVTPVHAAVAERSEPVMINDSDDEWLINSTIDQSSDDVEVKGVAITDLLDQCGLGQQRIALLKCNIEGAEVAALKSMDSVVHLLDNAAISCHDFIGQRSGNASFRTYEWVREWFVAHGFDVSSRADSRPWVADTVYATRTQRPAS